MDHVQSLHNNWAWDVSCGQTLTKSVEWSVYRSNEAIVTARSERSTPADEQTARVQKQIWSVNGDVQWVVLLIVCQEVTCMSSILH